MTGAVFSPQLVDAERLARDGIEVIRQSAHDVVVIKPAGMATELTSDPKWASLISKVRQACAEGVGPRLVHRLDRVTSGIVMITLTKQATTFYGEQIREGMWDKYYLGRIPEPDPKRNPLHQGLLSKHKAHIKEIDKRAAIVRSGGKPSILEVLALAPAPGRPGEAHLLINLLTGRLHQIRVMLAGLGLPLIGDDFYGGAPGEMYLEHVLLRYVESASKEMRVAFREKKPGREQIARGVWQRVLDESRRTIPA